MKLFLIRHAETIENRQKILQGHLPGRLSEKGMQQAKKLALRFKNEKIDYVYCSDLTRAVDTAKQIMKFHINTPIEFVMDLRERDIGNLAGKKGNFSIIEDLPGAESIPHFKKRIFCFLNKVYKKHKDSTIVFVTHGGCILLMLSKFLDTPVENIRIKKSNAAVNIIEINENKNYVLHLINCTKHLDKQNL